MYGAVQYLLYQPNATEFGVIEFVYVLSINDQYVNEAKFLAQSEACKNILSKIENVEMGAQSNLAARRMRRCRFCGQYLTCKFTGRGLGSDLNFKKDQKAENKKVELNWKTS